MQTRALRVIAYDDNHVPILAPAQRWEVELREDLGKVDLRLGKHCISYVLADECKLAWICDEKQEIAVGKTMGRMLLTGIGSGSFKHGSALGGAILDLSLRGAEKRKLLTLRLAFEDTNVVEVDGDATEINAIYRFCPQRARTEAAVTWLAERFDLVERMSVDGPIVLTELRSRRVELARRMAEGKATVASGATFEDRDKARAVIKSLEQQARDVEQLARTVRYVIAANGEPATQALPHTRRDREADVGAVAGGSYLAATGDATGARARPAWIVYLLVVLASGFLGLIAVSLLAVVVGGAFLRDAVQFSILALFIAGGIIWLHRSRRQRS